MPVHVYDLKQVPRLIFLSSVEGTDDWRILIVDGHASHVNYEFLHYAETHRIRVICLPSHCSGTLQPMDVAMFRPLQQAYTREVDEMSRAHLPINNQTFPKYVVNVSTTYNV